MLLKKNNILLNILLPVSLIFFLACQGKAAEPTAITDAVATITPERTIERTIERKVPTEGSVERTIERKVPTEGSVERSAEDKADREKIIEGTTALCGVSSEEYAAFIDDALSENFWKFYVTDDKRYSDYIKQDADEYVIFDSLTEMIMALDAGRVDRIEFQQPVGEYFMKQGDNANKYVILFYLQGVDYYLSMGFKEGSKWLEPFNEAIRAMNEDDTLLFLKAKYADTKMPSYSKASKAKDTAIRTVNTAGDSAKNGSPAEFGRRREDGILFDSFPGAETVKIAVTGDFPPIDYVAIDGTSAGFNVALLAEIARRLKINVELVSINSGARGAALSSGRVDGVFWFWFEKSSNAFRDVPKGVALTEPYYSWDTFMFVGKRLPANTK